MKDQNVSDKDVELVEKLNDKIKQVKSEIEKRIVAVTPESGRVKSMAFQEFKFTACRTSHGDTYDIENNAYIINFGGVNVFHSGDSWKEALLEWNGIEWNFDKSITLHFLNVLKTIELLLHMHTKTTKGLIV